MWPYHHISSQSTRVVCHLGPSLLPPKWKTLCCCERRSQSHLARWGRSRGRWRCPDQGSHRLSSRLQLALPQRCSWRWNPVSPAWKKLDMKNSAPANANASLLVLNRAWSWRVKTLLMSTFKSDKMWSFENATLTYPWYLALTHLHISQTILLNILTPHHSDPSPFLDQDASHVAYRLTGSPICNRDAPQSHAKVHNDQMLQKSFPIPFAT